MSKKNILELSSADAESFFLNSKNYFTLELPSYFDFTELLSKTNDLVKGKNISDLIGKNPKNFMDLNHKLFHNKDGKYAWRCLELINPILYIVLVQKITQENNWKEIQTRFKCFSKNKKIQCVSIPVIPKLNKKYKAEQISNWCEEVEKKSIELAIDYEYLFHTDISECYSSIYTHSIAWALHGKEKAKKEKNNKSLIGNIIDNIIRDFSHGETNGIPQGSVLMDLIAEMILGYADSELFLMMKKTDIKDYRIIRYRDDYRIFVNNPRDGDIILKTLTEVLIGLGLKLNTLKTKGTNQVIVNAIKEDKLFWNLQVQKNKNPQKYLLIIHHLSVKFPNSGSLAVALNNYYKSILSKKVSKKIIIPLISIAIDIAFHNPRCYPVVTAILSKIISLINNKKEKLRIIKKIKNKFNKVPNTGHLEIWLQRITKEFNEIKFNEPLCVIASDEKNLQLNKIWNFDWISCKTIKECVNSTKIVNHKLMEELNSIISRKEIEIFNSPYY